MMLGIIPARSGSKGIINKNIKLIAGKRLLDWTIETAIGILPCIITSNYNLKGRYCIKRPPSLCKDGTPMLPVIRHAIKKFEKASLEKVDSICLLQPTSPLRTKQDIINAINLYKIKKTGVYSYYNIALKENNKVFDKYKAKYHCQRNGAIFIATREMIDNGHVFDENSIGYEMPMSRSIDIDTKDDWHIAESLLKNLKGEC